MAKRTDVVPTATTDEAPQSDYKLHSPESLQSPAPRASVSTIQILHSNYTAANVTATTDKVVLVLNMGTTRKRDQIRELNAKLQGIMFIRSGVSSEG